MASQISEALEQELAGWMACPDYSSLCPTCWREYIAQFSKDMQNKVRRYCFALLSVLHKNPKKWQADEGQWRIQCEWCSQVSNILVSDQESTAPLNS